MTTRRPLAPDGAGGMSQIGAPDTIDSSIFPTGLGYTPSTVAGDFHVPDGSQVHSAMPMTIGGFLYMDGGFLIEILGA